MKFPAYAKYKDSGVQWLGEVPEHWEVKRLRRLTSRVTDGAHVSPDLSSDDYPFVSTVDIKNGQIDFEGCLRTSTESFHCLLRNGCKPFKGDVLFSKDGTVGRTTIVKEEIDFIVASSLVIITPKSTELNACYLNYFLNNALLKQEVELLMAGAALRRISIDKVGRLPCLLPSLTEQTAIADFLDRETERIDTLVAKKRRLIALLGEKRTALISRTVTRGLPADAAREFGLESHTRFKDSGIEWLGKVPEGWEVKRIKHACRILRGKFSHRPRNDPRLYDGEYPFIQTGDVSGAEKYISGYQQTLNEEGFAVSKLFPRGTLVMTIAANIGDVAILDFEACFPDSIVGFVPGNNVQIDFLYLLFQAMNSALMSTATLNTQLNLNIERIGSLQAGIPSLPEQTAIATYLGHKIAKIDQLVAKVEAAIVRLLEYRTALITAAVTGKIDVRGHRHSRACGSPEEVL